MLDLATATLATFAPHVGTTFVLEHPVQRESFMLAQADPLSAHSHQGDGREPFALLFDGSRTDIRFDQQILPLTHETIGEVALFLVPIARNTDGTTRYQAVFN